MAAWRAGAVNIAGPTTALAEMAAQPVGNLRRFRSRCLI